MCSCALAITSLVASATKTAAPSLAAASLGDLGSRVEGMQARPLPSSWRQRPVERRWAMSRQLLAVRGGAASDAGDVR